MDRIPPVTTTHGIHESKITASRHPLTKAITKPPIKVEASCINFPTYHYNFYCKYNKGGVREKGKPFGIYQCYFQYYIASVFSTLLSLLNFPRLLNLIFADHGP